MNKLALFIFHRDCRLEDHPGLEEAVKTGLNILPVFIFDPAQLAHHPYQSLRGLHFLLDSLEDLSKKIALHQGELFILKGKTSEVVKELLNKLPIAWLGSSEDVTPFARERDADISSLCKHKGIPFSQSPALFLHHPQMVHKDDGKPYTVFTPFFRKALTISARPRVKAVFGPWALDCRPLVEHLSVELSTLRPNSPSAPFKGGRTTALQLLKQLPSPEQYTQQRDFPAQTCGSLLSAHLKFGTVSPWEVARVLEKKFSEHPIVRQLFWRDFFYHIAVHFPRIFTENFQKQTQHIPWSNSLSHFEAWCQGRTGFPIVDAAMRELVATGTMHNRCRMITASFLVKDLHLDWRWGERFFAQQLVDYDPAVNNGNWQWAASTGCDAQPYFRIFNPWLQQKKFDAQGEYIRHWVEELRGQDAKILHGLFNGYKVKAYPSPIVNHQVNSQMAKSLFATGQSSSS